MISKKEFCNVINNLKRNDEFINKLNNVFSEFGKEENIYSTGIEDTLVELLEIIFNDKDNRWISYWIWELNFGEKYQEGSVTENGNVIPLKTSEDLYNLLVTNLNKNYQRSYAKWIINCDGYYPYCSNCKNEPPGRKMTKFCPECGKEMVQSQSELRLNWR